MAPLSDATMLEPKISLFKAIRKSIAPWVQSIKRNSIFFAKESQDLSGVYFQNAGVAKDLVGYAQGIIASQRMVLDFIGKTI